jgi:hypothetical protein
MKLFGYEVGSDTESPLHLREVTVSADAGTLRKLAHFLLFAATELERHGQEFGHEHFQDYDGTAPKAPSFVITGPR